MQVVFFKQYAEVQGLPCNRRLSGAGEMMKYTYASSIQNAVDEVARMMPKADVAVLPSGGNVIPQVR
jgi:hypothetical protein